MEGTKTDRRINRTRRQLRDAFLTLILEKGYDAVTVEDITERADLGRTTFYLHYKDKEDLLLESLTNTAEELKAQVNFLADWNRRSFATPAASSPAIPPAIPPANLQGGAVQLAFQHVSENAKLYKVILKGEGATKGLSMIRQIIIDSVLEYFNLWMLNVPDHQQPVVPLEVMASYFASSLLGFITWWLENDMPISADKMRDIFIEMFYHGAYHAMGLPGEEI